MRIEYSNSLVIVSVNFRFSVRSTNTSYSINTKRTKIQTQKKGRVFNNKNEILNFIQNKIGNNNYLMVKGSNSTGLNTIVSKLKSI